MAKRGRVKRVEADSPLESLGGNSYIHVKRIPNPAFAPLPSIVETVLFSKVGHTFGPLPFPGQPQMYVVQDFLMDQTGASGCDGKMAGTKNFDLTTSTSYRFNVFPKDRTKRIKVAPPPSVQVHMGLDGGRRFVNAVSDYADAFSASNFFVNLQGPAPVFSYNFFFIGHNTNHWTQFNIMADIVAPFSFLGFTTIGSYPMRTFDPGTKAYTPYSTSLPYNLPGQNSAPYLMFGYWTSNSTDPGPFVFLG